MMNHTCYTIIRNILFLFLAVLYTQPAFAEYKPVDISDITGDQRKELMEVKKRIARMPVPSRDCFICEQLGLLFMKDGSQAMLTNNGYPGTKDRRVSCFIGKNGRPEAWEKAYQAAALQYGKSYKEVQKFKRDAVVGLFKKDVDKITLNTAKHLLKTMPDEFRWLHLAIMGNMCCDKQTQWYADNRNSLKDESGIVIVESAALHENYVFWDIDGKEHRIPDIKDRYLEKYWRWWRVIWRCENLVGAKDILALFPDEVKAMRKHFKDRVAALRQESQMQDSQEQTNALLAALRGMEPDQRRAWLAEHAGFCYPHDSKPAYQSEHTANDNAFFVDAQGQEHKLSEVARKDDEKWVAATEAALALYSKPILLSTESAKLRLNYSKQLLDHYGNELRDIARKTVHFILTSEALSLDAPTVVWTRQSFIALLNHFLVNPDAENTYTSDLRTLPLKCGVTVYTRIACKYTSMSIPLDLSYPVGMYYSPKGKKISTYSIRYSYELPKLIYYCASLIGTEPINSLFPDEVQAMRTYYANSPFYKK